MGEQSDKVFVSVECSIKHLIAVTMDAILCIFSLRNFHLKKYMNLEARAAHSLDINENVILVGCSDGLIRCFDCQKIQHLVTFPRPPPLGGYNIKVNECTTIQASQNDQYADV